MTLKFSTYLFTALGVFCFVTGCVGNTPLIGVPTPTTALKLTSTSAVPTGTPIPADTPTSFVPTATTSKNTPSNPQSAGHTVSGHVAEFPSCEGSMRGVTVALKPTDRTTATDLLPGGSFAFSNVPDGDYTLVVLSPCNPYGCWQDTPVTVAAADVYVGICMNAPTATAILRSEPTPPSVELIVMGRLVRMSDPPDCGVFHFGAVAEYSDLTVLSGTYAHDVVFVIHGCPELRRSEYAAGSGDLESFRVGEYHELHLTSQNVNKVEIYPGDIKPTEGLLYFCKTVNLYKK